MNILKEYFADNHKIIIVDAFLSVDELSLTDVAVLSKIIMLSDNPHGGCTAGNIFFADLLNISEGRIGKIIHKLDTLNYVTLNKTLDGYGHKVRLITPIIKTILDKTGKQYAEKNGANDENFPTKNPSQTLTPQGKSHCSILPIQKNRRKQKNNRTEERQSHEQKTISEIDWTDFGKNASSDSDLTFCVSDFSDSGLVKKLEEHMHTTQAYGLIRQFGAQTVEEELNKVNNNKEIKNKGGYLMAVLNKSYETQADKDKTVEEAQTKKEQLKVGEKNWDAINQWLNTNSAKVQKFYQDLVDGNKPDGRLVNDMKHLLMKHPTGFNNKAFDIMFGNRSVTLNSLRGTLHPEVVFK
jgi:DNA-binding transcriptional regulator GbsR (MarR family)